MSWLIYAAWGFSGLYLLAFCYRAESWAKTLIKTVPVLLLAVLAALADAPKPVTAALALCALGDYCLSRPGERAFLLGVASFAAGHVAYIVQFLLISDVSREMLWPALAIVAFAAVMMRLFYAHAGALRIAVLAYVPIIAVMGITALYVPPEGPYGLILPAALLFMASDTILALELFVLREGHPARAITPFAIWTLYWLAQVGFFLGFVSSYQSLA